MKSKLSTERTSKGGPWVFATKKKASKGKQLGEGTGPTAGDGGKGKNKATHKPKKH